MKTTLNRLRMTMLEDLPNVGPAIAADFVRLGIRAPRELVGRDPDFPYTLYEALNRITGTRHDPCVLDTFIAAVRFMEGAPARPWWKYTAERKRTLAKRTSRTPPEPAKRKAKALNGAVKIASAPLTNIGPVSKRMLAAAGITSIETLRRLGAIEAYRRVRSHDPRASLNLLWALEGALTGRPWEDVARNDRLSLLLQLDNRS
ncbi:MAG TPA: helix-hairpin-helix domain-containing protein [Casimicrobiaceae bacterium]